MSNLIFIVPAVIALSGVLLWLLLPQLNISATPASSFHPERNEGLPTPKHYKYFRQVRQALSSEDCDYLNKFAPPPVAKKALQERRAVARAFLKGLYEEFLMSHPFGAHYRRAIAGSEPTAGNRTAPAHFKIPNFVWPYFAASFHGQHAHPAIRTSDGFGGQPGCAHG